MVAHILADAGPAIPLHLLTPATRDAWLAGRSVAERAWAEAAGFTGKAGQILRLPHATNGSIAAAAVGIGEPADPWSYGDLSAKLGRGRFKAADAIDAAQANALALGWALGTYAFDRYKEQERELADLVWPANADRAAVTRAVDGIFLARDLVNTPANDMGPDALADAAAALAKQHRARIRIEVGDQLLKLNYPTIHAVGRAAEKAPRLIDIIWGKRTDPKVTLVGKGVCFDTGGLDLKPAGGMKLMKKDMGGAAAVLALAHMIMDADLPVRLRVLIPAVENSVAGNAFRPLDVIRTRSGKTVEIGNTDAEGRLILCDALTEADSENPELLIDCATLTGAARVALGPDLPALFCNDEAFAADLLAAGVATHDQTWRLPLYRPYAKMLDSDVADLNNAPEGGFAGAITAALYLEKFVSAETKWAHVDMMAWNPSAKPGRPRGGEAPFIRGAFAAIAKRYGR